jgi:predicted permease
MSVTSWGRNFSRTFPALSSYQPTVADDVLVLGLQSSDRDAPPGQGFVPVARKRAENAEAEMGTLLQDLKYGVRMLLKNPGFTAVAIITLALGIGVNTAVFSVVNGVLLNPLPFHNPDQLVALYEHPHEFERSSISYPNFLDWQRRNSVFSQIAVYRSDSFNLTGSGEAEQVDVMMVSSDFFSILGVSPVSGRTLTKDDDHVGAARTVMLGEGLWKRKFGGRPDVIGSQLTLSGKSYQVIGVIPAFSLNLNNYESKVDAFMPVGIYDDGLFQTHRDVHEGMDAIARMKPGVTLAQAKAEMNGIAQQMSREYPEDKNSGITIGGLKEEEVGDVRGFLLVLLGAVCFVMLIACVNVANLQLARSTTRAREFAVRTAMGASPGRVIRQLLTESLILAAAGGAIGLLIAWQGTRIALKVLPEALPRAENVGLDVRVLLFTLGVSIIAGIFFGLAPALKTIRPNVQETLKESGRGASGAKHRAQSVFVAVEMALALVLLVGAGLMVRSLFDLWHVDPGFNPHNVANFGIVLSPDDGTPAARYHESLRQVHEALAALPGVQAVAITGGALPMQGDNELPFWLDGTPKPASTTDENESLFYFVDEGYMAAMGIQLKSGRWLTPTDNEKGAAVVVVDEKFAKQFFPGQDAVSRYINMDLINLHAQIVGIVNHVKHWGLDTDATSKIQAQLYMPYSQIPDKFLSGPPQANVVVRTAGPPLAMTATWKKTLEGMNSENVMFGVKTMDDVIAGSMAARRFSMILLAVFAVLALILSCVGIFGVISYVVTQRTHEIGIRMALGAQREDVLRLMLGEGMQMALAGVAVGLVASLFLTRLIVKLLYGVSATDPVTFLGVAVILSFVALAACYIPTRRAMRVDPMVALRYE